MLCAAVAAAGCSAKPAPEAPFDWTFAPAADVAIEAEETGRRTAPEGHTPVAYRIRGHGFPESGTYVVRTRNLPGVEHAMAGLRFVDGVLSYEDPQTGEMKPFELETGTMLAGEGLQVAVYSPDRSLAARTELLPHPLEVSAPGGCRLSARVWSQLAYAVVIEGFQGGEHIELELVAGDWMRRWPIENFEEGSRGMFVVDPRDSGYRGGVAHFYATSPSCAVSLDLPFGDNMLPR